MKLGQKILNTFWNTTTRRLTEGRLMLYQRKKLYPYVSFILRILTGLLMLDALLMVVTVTLDYGMVAVEHIQFMLDDFYWNSFILFHVAIISRLLFSRGADRLRLNPISWVLLLFFFLTLVPFIFKKPEEDVLGQVWVFLNSMRYRLGIMTLISILLIVIHTLRALEKRVNPTMILAISFFLIIIVGCGILLLPRCSSGLDYLDALFLSTSAVCVTGLSTVDYASVLTPSGMTFLCILFQVGGLGVMTFTNFFTMFFMGNTSIYSQMMVRDMLSQNSLNSLLRMLWNILMFTFIIELSGAVLIFLSVHGTLSMDLGEEIAFSLFHSVSAFCNAGFSSISGGLSNDYILLGHVPFFLILSFLVILGGIGFPVLVNMKDTLRRVIGRLYHRLMGHPKVRTRYHEYSLNTRLVLWTTLMLLVGSTLCFFCLEYNNTLAGYSVWERLTHAFFMAVTPRSAGFGGIPVGSWAPASLLLLCLLCFIGGSSQSTAGGIKVGTFAIVIKNIWSVLRGKEHMVVFKREISSSSINRSNATAFLFILFLLLGTYLLCVLEPHFSAREMFFEAIAALSTCGLSLGVTPQLGNGGKIVLMVLMFIGRLGVLTLLLGIIRPQKGAHYRHPSGEIIIN